MSLNPQKNQSQQTNRLGRPVKIIDDKTKLKVKQLREDRYTYANITEQTGLSYVTIKKILNENQPQVQKKQTRQKKPSTLTIIVPDETKQQIKQLRADRYTYREVCEKTGFSYYIVKKALRELENELNELNELDG